MQLTSAKEAQLANAFEVERWYRHDSNQQGKCKQAVSMTLRPSEQITGRS
jgi:hypothetical protein